MPTAKLTPDSKPSEAHELETSGKHGEVHSDNPKIQNALLSLASQCHALKLPIVFRLPKKSLITGCVLKHALAVTDEYLARYRPMVYKFGFSHCPIWRWSSPLYGYCHDMISWTGMVILHMSHEAYGPAMLEACLIHQHEGALPQLSMPYTVGRYTFLYSKTPWIVEPCKFASQSRPAWLQKHSPWRRHGS